MRGALIILGLFLTGTVRGKPTFTPVASLPPELEAGLQAVEAGASQQSALDLPEPELEELAFQKVKASLPGGRTLLVPEMPEVPFLTRQFALSPGMTGRVVLANIQVETSSEAVALKRVPPELVWNPRRPLRLKPRAVTRFFPGRFFSSAEHAGVVHLTVFPVQYDRQTGKLLTLRTADVFLAEEPKPTVFQIPDLWAAPSLILTPERLLAGAKALADFHERQLGVKTDVVTVESIARTESPISEDELPEGYKHPHALEQVVLPYDATTGKGYRYGLARKLIRFLQGRMADGGSTRYVTLLGDASLIPPSYYFKLSGEIGATDACYAAVDQCLHPKLTLGRLPFTSDDQVRNFLTKTARWLGAAGTSPSELSLYAGRAFPTDLYLGEVGVLKTINSPSDNWRGLRKFFRSRGNYDKRTVLAMMHGQAPSPFVYQLDHGLGNVWSVDDALISANEVLSATDTGNLFNPIVASIACTNAAFDEEMLKADIFYGKEYGDVSIGEAMLLSKAGAVAYLGSLREALGQPVFDVDVNGNLNITGTTYDLQLLDGWLAQYEGMRGGRLGDSLLKSQVAYLFENGNDLKDEDTRYAFYNLELLGDPALPLPARTSVETNYGLPRSTTQGLKPAVSDDSLPSFPLAPGAALRLTFRETTEVVATLYRQGSDASEPEQTVLRRATFGDATGEIPVVFPSKAEGNYFLRLENQRGVPSERQVWFEADKPSTMRPPGEGPSFRLVRALR